MSNQWIYIFLVSTPRTAKVFRACSVRSADKLAVILISNRRKMCVYTQSALCHLSRKLSSSIVSREKFNILFRNWWPISRLCMRLKTRTSLSVHFVEVDIVPCSISIFNQRTCSRAAVAAVSVAKFFQLSNWIIFKTTVRLALNGARECCGCWPTGRVPQWLTYDRHTRLLFPFMHIWVNALADGNCPSNTSNKHTHTDNVRPIGN